MVKRIIAHAPLVFLLSAPVFLAVGFIRDTEANTMQLTLPVHSAEVDAQVASTYVERHAKLVYLAHKASGIGCVALAICILWLVAEVFHEEKIKEEMSRLGF